jgi:hypothetical protein
MGQSCHLLHPFQLSLSLDAGSCSFICDKTTKSVSSESWTVVEIKSKADYVGQGGPIKVLCNGFLPVLPNS